MLGRQFQDIYTGEWSNLSICLTSSQVIQLVDLLAFLFSLPTEATHPGNSQHCSDSQAAQSSCTAQDTPLHLPRLWDGQGHSLPGTETGTVGSHTQTGTERSQTQCLYLLPPPGADLASSTPTGVLKEWDNQGKIPCPFTIIRIFHHPFPKVLSWTCQSHAKVYRRLQTFILQGTLQLCTLLVGYKLAVSHSSLPQ